MEQERGIPAEFLAEKIANAIVVAERRDYEGLDIVHCDIDTVKEKVPNAKIYIWSGYVYEELVKCEEIKTMLQKCDYLIDGPYQAELRDLTLEMRGSSNQRIIALKD